MRPTKLLNLLATNAKRGSFKAEGNTLYLYDVIVGSDAEAEFWGGVSPEAFAKALVGMTGDVSLRINSPGGDVFAGVAMAQAIRAYPGKVTAHVDGLAASAASAVAVACDEAVMAPGSMMMIHNAWTLGLGNRHDFMDLAALLEKIDGDLAQAYAKRSGGDAAAYSAMMDKETWLSAEETVENGLANAIAPEKAAQNLTKFDLSAFEAAPATGGIVEASAAIVGESGPEMVIHASAAEKLKVFGSKLEALGPQNDTLTVTVTLEIEDDAETQMQARVRQLSARLLQEAA